ncbi:MAG: response regulator [Hyphomicrobiaceae bacterium]
MNVGQSRLRVLVVENEVLLQLEMEDMLSELGHEIVGWASRARTAIAETERTRPDVVLMDIQLDGPRDGIEAAHEIRERFGITSLFMTGSNDSDTYRRALATRPLGYLRKPFMLSDLRSALKPLLGMSHERAVSPTHTAPMANAQFAFFDMARKTSPSSFD